MNRLRGKGSWLVVGVLALATMVLVGLFFMQLADVQDVVVARSGLLAGTRLTADNVEVRTIHTSAVLPGAVGSVTDVEGQLLSVPRMPGDQITVDMIGDQAISGLAATLPPDHRAIAVRVTQDTGLAGVIRAGDTVGVVVIIDTVNLRDALGLTTIQTTQVGTRTVTTARDTAVNPQTVARLVLHDVKVAMVPQMFRYEEVPVDDTTGDPTMAPLSTSASAQQNSVVVLDVPLTPVEIGGSDTVSPTIISAPELLALVNARGTIHLILQPTDRVAVQTPGLNLLDLIVDILGWERKE
ncbi:MAG: hypothetical protein KKA73_13605 [Chloroflexi bacterium]|nr:hypothetical protein [Chloroflexota bacterium]